MNEYAYLHGLPKNGTCTEKTHTSANLADT